jgi:hypothetical protein
LPVVGLAAHDARPDQNWMFGAVFSTTLGVVLSKVFRMLAAPLSRSFGSTGSAPAVQAAPRFFPPAKGLERAELPA